MKIVDNCQAIMHYGRKDSRYWKRSVGLRPHGEVGPCVHQADLFSHYAKRVVCVAPPMIAVESVFWGGADEGLKPLSGKLLPQGSDLSGVLRPGYVQGIGQPNCTRKVSPARMSYT